jgi:uncharacterized protein (TIGR02300 family)
VTPFRRKAKGRSKATPKRKTQKKPKATTRKKAGARKTAKKSTAAKAPRKAKPKARPQSKAPGKPRAPVKAQPAAAPPPAPKAPAPRRAARSRAKAPRAPLPTPPTPAGVEPRSKLGVKYACFECGAKFYDLNRPEPLCPKCGADQRNRPAGEVKLKTLPEPRRRTAGRAMAPLLVEDEDEVVIEDDGELDLELGVVDSPDDIADDDEEEANDEP